MSNEQINVAIASACGWTELNNNPDWGWLGRPPNCIGKGWPILDYCNCLNAMHEAQQFIPNALWEAYIRALAKVTGAEDSCGRDFLCATARQRAEAFLRTIGKWDDKKATPVGALQGEASGVFLPSQYQSAEASQVGKEVQA